MRKLLYDRISAVNYAKKWAYARNPKYYNFDKLGGDCTNFVSQCIFAGSLIMNYKPITGWYFNSLHDRAPAWTGVEFLYNFLINNDGVGPFGKINSLVNLNIGDVIFLRRRDNSFYHSLIVTNKVNDEYFVSSHTIDGFNRPLFSYNLNNAVYLSIEGVNTK